MRIAAGFACGMAVVFVVAVGWLLRRLEMDLAGMRLLP